MNLTFVARRSKDRVIFTDNRPEIRLYEELYLRWLLVRREYASNTEPPPVAPPCLTAERVQLINSRIYRDLYRP